MIYTYIFITIKQNSSILLTNTYPYMYIVISQVAFMIFIFTDNMYVKPKIKQGFNNKKGERKRKEKEKKHINIKFSFLYIYILIIIKGYSYF